MITLANIAQATHQEIFDQVTRRLLLQGVPSVDGAGKCRYRADGMNCAAGCLMSDEEYTSAFEGYGWGQLRELGLIPHEHFYVLVRVLRNLHDNRSPGIWKAGLAVVADEFGLATEVLDEFP